MKKTLLVALLVVLLASFVLATVAEASGPTPCRKTTYNWRAKTKTVCYDMFWGGCPKGWSSSWWIVDNLRLATCASGASSCCFRFKIWEVWQ